MTSLILALAMAFGACGCAKRSRVSRSVSTSTVTGVLQSSRDLRLGDRLDGAVQSNELLITGSGGIEPLYYVMVRGVHFKACANQDQRITYVDTTDVLFETPEGIRVGDSIECVRAVTQAPLVHERGWAKFVRLPSGWGAAFAEGTSDGRSGGAPLGHVTFVFLR